MKRQYINRFLEFFLVGVMMGMAEDFLAIVFATDAKINTRVLIVVFIVAIPFAVFSELIVDWRHFKKIRRLKKQIDELTGKLVKTKNHLVKSGQKIARVKGKS